MQGNTTPSPAVTPKQDWYAQGLRFTCTQCGNCCTGPEGYVWYTDEEELAMAERLKVSREQFRTRYAHQVEGHWSLMEKFSPDGSGYDCVFLQRTEEGRRICQIYDVRPTQCRTWPFWPENLKSPAAWRSAGRRCPGMIAGMEGVGKLYPVEQIRIIRDQTPLP
ncbi:MAG: YkgJ family cysteine cluster protein [Phycisphaeraceae bacterium]|nr:YkgJ family cysteine cluster protein [Phycisphaeraceae bacterium]